MKRISKEGKKIEKQAIRALERCGFASASYLSRHYIDASPQKIGNIINHSEHVEMIDPSLTKKTWRLKE